MLCCAVLCYAADEGIPDFWLTAMANHDMIGEYVTERDAEVLSHLRDVRHISLTGDDAGSFKVEFHFDNNPFFTNEVRPSLAAAAAAAAGGGGNGGRRGSPACWTRTPLLLNIRQWFTIAVVIHSFISGGGLCLLCLLMPTCQLRPCKAAPAVAEDLILS
jgi:hypothetical protein